MKSKISLAVALVILSIGLFSCQSSGTKEDKVATLETSQLDAKKLKDEIVEIIMTIPNYQEIVKLINETGAAYVGGLTLENYQTSDLLTRSSGAKVYGVVLFDMAYANTYNQLNTFSKLLEINKSLVKKLGFEEFLKQQKQYETRYKANKNQRDSVDQIIVELLNSSNDYLQTHGNASDIAMVFAGASIKSLFVLSNVTVFAMNNEKLVDLMENQKVRIEAAYNILDMTADDHDVKKMAKAIEPILELFKDTEPFNITTVEKIRELTSFIAQ